MHILYLYQHFSTRSGSTGTRAYEMAQQLLAQGHEVTMVCGIVDTADTGLAHGESSARGNVDGINVIQLPYTYSNKHSLLKRAWNFLRYSVDGIRLAVTEDYDLLFATSTPLTAAIPGVVMTRLPKAKPFVFEVRDVWPDLPIALGGLNNRLVVWVLSRLERLAYDSADLRIGLAPGICQTIDERTKSDPNAVLIPNGADTELFRPAPSGAQPGRFRAVFTGTHGVANGLDAVLDVAAELKRRGRHDIELHFIGGGNQKANLTDRAARSELTNCVFHDPIPKVDLARILPTYDAGLMVLADVSAFYFGTSPNKFFDYLAAGLPVINNYPGWLAGLIADNGCGVAVPPRDPGTFADALEQLADDQTLRAAYGRAARELAESDFERGQLAQEFVATLEAALPTN